MKSPLSISRAMNTLIEGSYWPQCVKTGIGYARRHDDTDGENDPSQYLAVQFSPDGDAWVVAGNHSLRFRTYFGGGQSVRVRNALMVLAEAIRRDNQERPQSKAIDPPAPPSA